jgi:hypothetical protein
VTKPPVTNIRIVSPQSELDPGHRFRRAFLDQLRPFTTLRTMDMMKTNSNTVIKWSERSWPEDFSSGKAHGVPFEDLVSLANESGKNLWINIPTLPIVISNAPFLGSGNLGNPVGAHQCRPEGVRADQ